MPSSTSPIGQNVGLNSSMTQSSPPTTDVVTSSLSLTFIDLLSMNYDTFREELAQLHALMQYMLTDSTANAYPRFEGLGWWYCMTHTPSSYERTNPLWYPFNSPGAYQNMLNRYTSSLDTENVTLELTNNLEYIDSDMTLPISAYPTTTIDGQAESVKVYPAYFTLKQAADVRLPPASATPYPPPHKPTQQADDTLGRLHLHLREFERGLPLGFTMRPLATAPTLQSPPSSMTPRTPRPKPITAVLTPYTLPTTPLPTNSAPSTALPTPPTNRTSPLSASSPPSPSLPKATTQLQHQHPHLHPQPPTLKPTQRPSTPTTQYRPTSPPNHPPPNTSNNPPPPPSPTKHINPKPQPRPRPNTTFGTAPYISPTHSIYGDGRSTET